MPQMIMLRDYSLVSTLGLSVRFKKGVAAHVPPELVPEAMEKGAVLADGKAPEFEEPSTVSIPQGEERAALILEAVRELVDKNSADDFGANGAPKVAAVKRELGLDVDRAEIAEAWKLVQAGA